jgi:hypothetical protein
MSAIKIAHGIGYSLSHSQIARLYRPDGLWFWVWNGIVTALMVLSVVFVYSRKSRWTRDRRMMATELRLESAWEHTKEALQLPAPNRLTAKERAFLAEIRPRGAAGEAKEGVLSNLAMGVTQQTVQQSKISCDI